MRPTTREQLSLADITERLMAEFEDRHALTDIVRIVASSGRDLSGTPGPARPELVERLARQRLQDATVRATVPLPAQSRVGT
jgi:hypothetical protein